MKNLIRKCRSGKAVISIFILTMLFSQLSFAQGIYDGDILVGGNWYNLPGSNSYSYTNFNGVNLGTFGQGSTFSITGGIDDTYRNFGSQNICGGTLNYYIKNSSGVTLSSSNFNLPFSANLSSTNQEWKTTSVSVNLLSGLAPGNYTVGCYLSSTGDNNSSGCSTTYYLSNGGSNYVASFSVVYSTTSTGGNWSSGSTWVNGSVPPSGAAVFIDGPTTLDQAATVSSLTINSSKTLTGADGSLRTLTVSSGGTFTNNGTFTATSNSIVNFAGTATINGSSTTTFNDVLINGTVTISTVPTISDTLKINGGNLTAAPNYGSSSTLDYNTNGSYTASVEWAQNTGTGAGIPQNVAITGVATSLNFGTATQYHQMNGNMAIGTGNTFALSTTAGGDLYIKGSWTRAALGTFTPNCRAVQFNGTGTQTVTLTGGGTETFNFLLLNHTGTFKPTNNGTDNTDIKVAQSSCSGASLGAYIMQLLNTGTIDLNGRTISVDNINTGAANAVIYVTGSRTITNTASSPLTNGSFAFTGGATNQPTKGTVAVYNNAGTGSLTFDANVLLTIADGGCDFGASSGTAITTINGILQVNLGGNVAGNSCVYGSNSTLRFANTVDYQVYSGDKTWASGTTYSGNAGIPYNVQVRDAGTDLTLNTDRALRGNFTDTNGTLTLNTATFSVGGNWNRSGLTSSFTPNSNKVKFNGTSAQTITCTTGGTAESFYDLEIANTSGGVSTSTTGTQLNVSNQLTLTSGILTTGSNLVNMTSNASTAVTGQSTSSYVNGFVKRAVTALTSYDFPVGTSTNYELANINFSAGLATTTSLTANFSGGAPTAPDTTQCVVNNSKIKQALNAGYWTIAPDFQPSIGTYTVSLHMRGYSNAPAQNGAVTPAQQIAVIKRDSYLAGNAWLGCGNKAGVPQAYGVHTNSTQSIAAGEAVAVRSLVPSFSDFSIGSEADPSYALPVELISFEAHKIDANALLSWSTATEINNDHFEVESSTDGEVFNKIGEVAGNGNSTVIRNYTFIHKNIASLNASVIYYRLKQVDVDGKSVYTSIVAVNVGKTNSNSSLQFVSTYPNPFADHVNVAFYSGNAQTVKVAIYDIRGSLMTEETIMSDAGMNVYKVQNMAKLAKGFYTVTMTAAGQSSSFKMLKGE